MITPLSELVWDSKYRHRPADGAPERDLDASWDRVATAVAAVENDPAPWRERFLESLSEMRFLPAGRVIAGAGTGRRVTLFNCFVCRPPEDSIDSILDTLKETAVTMHQGGGVGIDFSRLRPAGSAATATGGTASGPVSFMRIWDSLCEVLLSTSTRRGAMLATLRCDHPDIRAFVDAKRRRDALHNFNLSVLVSDAFMNAVASDRLWKLHHPAAVKGDSPAAALPARTLWRQIAGAAHESAEPGVLFVDRINRENNLHYREQITATNPCGEVPLPPLGACNLGSLNLVKFVRAPFSGRASVDEEALAETVRLAVRFLDDVIDVSAFPLPQQAEQAHGSRRIGLGVTGLADLLIMLGLDYDSAAARAQAAAILQGVRDAAYETSISLAREKGAFPFLDRDAYGKSPFIGRLSAEQRSAIARHGIRNSHLLSIAPAGSISLLAGNLSGGIEPVFALEAYRAVRGRDGQVQRLEIRDCAYAEWLRSGGDAGEVSGCFRTAGEMPARAHLAMQACLQPLVDNAISKTVNLPEGTTAEEVADLYAEAYELGLKGCTVYRSGTFQGQVLEARRERACCQIEHE